jgi:hypothetical protein
MGTLYEQAPRRWHEVEEPEIDEFLSTVIRLAEKHGISVSDVIAASRVLELARQNNLYIEDGDAFDEQLAGLGRILESAIFTLSGE